MRKALFFTLISFLAQCFSGSHPAYADQDTAAPKSEPSVAANILRDYNEYRKQKRTNVIMAEDSSLYSVGWATGHGAEFLAGRYTRAATRKREEANLVERNKVVEKATAPFEDISIKEAAARYVRTGEGANELGPALLDKLKNHFDHHRYLNEVGRTSTVESEELVDRAGKFKLLGTIGGVIQFMGVAKSVLDGALAVRESEKKIKALEDCKNADVPGSNFQSQIESAAVRSVDSILDSK